MTRFLKSLATAGSALALALSSGACSQADTPAPATASATPVTAADYVTPALWMLQDEDTTIYLFGTVHLLPKDVEWFDGRIVTALQSSDELVTELIIDDPNKVVSAFMANGALPEGQNLRDLMSAEDRAEYEAALTAYGVPVETFDRMEPWLAAVWLGQLPLMQGGFDGENGVETVLERAVPGKPRGALEDLQVQIDMFDGLPMDAQIEYLDATVESLGEMGPFVDSLVAEWLAGDVDDLAKLVSGDYDDDPVLYQRLFTNRNASWTAWIDDRMDRPGTVFIAVGAGHLGGRDSVQSMLEARGFTVTRVTE